MPSSRTQRRAAKREQICSADAVVELAAEVASVACTLEVGIAVEPQGAHVASVILLHGLGDDAQYWVPFVSAFNCSSVAFRGIRWLLLKAPERKVWGQSMNAWFEYFTDRSGEDREDDINERQLVELREGLQSLIQKEADQLKDLGGAKRVLLIGSSQGGSAALDAALTWDGAEALGGVAMLRSLALGVTACAVARMSKAAAFRTKVLAVSGSCDKTFLLSLVGRQLGRFKDPAEILHEVVPGLGHDVEYDRREMAHTAAFIITCLNLSEPLDVDAFVQTLPNDTRPASEKGWADLSEAERTWAKQLGIKAANAWDSGTAPVWCKSWRLLSQEQARAATRLGFMETSWNKEEKE